MKETRLIIVTGMSGAGKSTTAQRIHKQFELNNVKHIWLHEEVANHPIRDNEFSFGNLKDEKDMDVNCDILVKRWETLTQAILKADDVYIIEGCLYQNIIRYFLDADYPEDKITRFFDRVMSVLTPLNPTLVFLRPKDVKKALNNVFSTRGSWWKELILKPETDGYFRTNDYYGEDSIYKMWEHYQVISDNQFYRFGGLKIQIDTTTQDWITTLQEIMQVIDLPYMNEETPWKPENYANYIGIFSNDKHRIVIFHEDGKLYCRAFWPYMLLNPVKQNTFEMASFPIDFEFILIENKQAIVVRGNYDWDIIGTILYKEETAR